MGSRCPFWDLGTNNIHILYNRTYLSDGKSCTEAVETAIKAGYRLIDTACAYRNHKEVGAAIKKCIDEGIVKREELFITPSLHHQINIKPKHLTLLCRSHAIFKEVTFLAFLLLLRREIIERRHMKKEEIDIRCLKIF